MGWVISPVHAAGLSPAHSIWVGLGPAQNGWARSSPVFLKKNSKIFFGILQFSRVFFMSFWLISSSIFMLLKIQHSVLKYPVFVKTLKKKHVFVFMHTTKSLKAKKLIFYFHTTKKTSKKKCFIMHFGFNNQFIKVTRIWPIFLKNPKKIILFLFISRITNLHVKRIPDIKTIVLL